MLLLIQSKVIQRNSVSRKSFWRSFLQEVARRWASATLWHFPRPALRPSKGRQRYAVSRKSFWRLFTRICKTMGLRHFVALSSTCFEAEQRKIEIRSISQKFLVKLFTKSFKDFTFLQKGAKKEDRRTNKT